MHNPRRLSLLRWIFEDRTTGRIVVAQAPNLWLWIFLAAFAASYFVRQPGPVYAIVKTAEYGSLAIWAVEELVRGVNPWRRFIGAVALGGIVFLVLKR